VALEAWGVSQSLPALKPQASSPTALFLLLVPLQRLRSHFSAVNIPGVVDGHALGGQRARGTPANTVHRPAVVALDLNPGRIALSGLRPQHLAQTQATFPLLFNALYLAAAGS